MSIYGLLASNSIVFTPTAAKPLVAHSGIATANVVFTPTCSNIGNRFVQAATVVSFGLTAQGKVLLPGDPTLIRTLLATGLSGRYPFNFAETADGLVLMSNGIDPMLRWDGTSGPAVPAGVPAPDTAVTVSVKGSSVSTEFIYGYVRFVDRNGNPSDLSPVSVGALGYATITSVTYSNVPVPSGLYAGKVFRRQLLRNTIGQTNVYYVDIDTFDLTGSTFTSTQGDKLVVAGEAVPIFNDLAKINANTHGFPPSWKSSVLSHLGRMFAAAEVAYRDGHAEVTAGGLTIRGVGTQWPQSFTGRSFYVPAAPESYTIASVDVDNQVLTLESNYEGPTDLFALYAVRAAPSERRLIYYTPAGEPESWPAEYALALQEDGDEISGLMSMASFLYILEKEHIYRFTFKDDPGVDGAIFLTSQRGCLSQRMFAQAEDIAYMLDEQGIHAFSGGQSEPISQPIQDIFRDDTDSPLRIDWDADQTLWSCSYSEVHATIRWFVAMTGTRYPRHAICYNYREQRWWIEEYKRPICSSTRSRIGVTRLLAGVDHREVLALDVGWQDGPRDPTGTLRGTVTAHTAVSLTDASANFTADMVNCAVFLTTGKGKGQWRRIVEVETATRLNLLSPWLITPNATTEYVVGGIDWKWLGGWFRYTEVHESDNSRDVEMVFVPQEAGTMDLEMLYNHSLVPRSWSVARDGPGVVTPGKPEVTVDLTFGDGVVTHRLDGHRERSVSGDRYMSPRLSGVQVAEPVRVYRVTVDGAEDVG